MFLKLRGKLLMTDKRFENIENRIWDLIVTEEIDKQAIMPLLAELDEYLAENSKNLEAWKLKCNALFGIEEPEAAIEACDKALRIAPDDIQLLELKAYNLRIMERYKDCIEIYQRILSIDPKNKAAIEDWDFVCSLSDDKSLPKPPKTIAHIFAWTLQCGFVLAIVCYLVYLILKTLSVSQ